MEKVKLQDVASFSKGQQINGDELIENGQYEYLNGGINPSGHWKEFNVNGNTVTISEGGNSCGYINYMKFPFWCGAHCYYLYNLKIDSKYLYYALKSQQEKIMKLRSGACMPNIKKSDLGNFELIISTDVNIQNQTVLILENISELINKRKQQLEKLDELVKSRFIEMFGTLENPVQEFKRATLKELCTKITDGKHGGCTQEEGTERYFVGAREIYDNIVHYDTAPEINLAEFEKDYKRCNVEIGDFLIVNTGATIGKSAIATDPRTECTLLQKSVALLKVKRELLNPVFLQYCYKVNEKMYKVESASAQPNLLLSKINSTEIYVPPIELQKQFTAFVEQTDKSKLEVQKSLEKLEVLKKALMQKYFG